MSDPSALWDAHAQSDPLWAVLSFPEKKGRRWRLQEFMKNGEREIAIYKMLAASMDDLRARATELVRGTECRVVESECALGGGTTPAETIPSVAVHIPGKATEVYSKFLRANIVGRIVEDRFLIDVRTLLVADVGAVAAVLHS